MKLAVVVITRGRADWLERCLRATARASRGRTTIDVSAHVLVNGPDEETRSRLASLGELGIAVEWTSLSTGVTPSKARNQLVRSLECDWVYFLDDDAYPREDVFDGFLRALPSGAVAIGGPNLTPPDARTFSRATGFALASRFATFLSFRRYRVSEELLGCGEESLILCNLFVERSALGAAPFPADSICGEENAMLSRLRSQGRPLLYSPGVVVWHERRGDSQSLARQVYQYGRSRSRGLLAGAAPAHPAHFIPSGCLLYCLAATTASAICGRVPGVAILPFPLYFSLCLVFARRALPDVKAYLLCAGLFAWIHLSYGAGFIAGFWPAARRSELSDA